MYVFSCTNIFTKAPSLGIWGHFPNQTGGLCCQDVQVGTCWCENTHCVDWSTVYLSATVMDTWCLVPLDDCGIQNKKFVFILDSLFCFFLSRKTGIIVHYRKNITPLQKLKTKQKRRLSKTQPPPQLLLTSVALAFRDIFLWIFLLYSYDSYFSYYFCAILFYIQWQTLKIFHTSYLLLKFLMPMFHSLRVYFIVS